jgi:ferritin-like metal-binding protein YciE
MQSLIQKTARVIDAEGPGEVRDVALIAAAQRIEHYEIAAYGTARALADQLDQGDARDLLGESLDEERQADELLTKLATGGLIVTGLNERAHG